MSIDKAATYDAWYATPLGSAAHFTTAGELRRLLERAGARNVEHRYGLYLPPWDSAILIRRASAIERLGRQLGPVGAAFVAARGQRLGAPASPPGSTGRASIDLVGGLRRLHRA
jgi:hypothetical protein